MRSERIPVAPAVLIWARESMSLDIDTAARRLGISAKTLALWEAGELNPTITQLRTAADKYKRPLGVLLLAEPPGSFDAMRDFRRHELSNRPWSPDLHGEFRRGLDQHEAFLEIAEVAAESLPTIRRPPTVQRDDDAERAGTALRDFLGITSAQQFGWTDPYEALNDWSDAVEATGIIVIHTRGISVDEMRAFSISEWPYPVIALNGADFPRARTFSLLHELTHLALNLGGLCDFHEQRDQETSDELEHFCNRIAAAALLPRAELLQIGKVQSASAGYDWSLDELSSIARRFQTSSEALLLRLISIGKADWPTYRRRSPELRSEYDAAIEHRREQRKKGRGGADFYRTKARDLGHGYANSVLDAFGSSAINARDAADFLDIKFGQLAQLQTELR